MSADPIDVAEAIAAARQAIQLDQDVNVEVARVLLDAVLRAHDLLTDSDDYPIRDTATFILTGEWL